MGRIMPWLGSLIDDELILDLVIMFDGRQEASWIPFREIKSFSTAGETHTRYCTPNIPKAAHGDGPKMPLLLFASSADD